MEKTSIPARVLVVDEHAPSLNEIDGMLKKTGFSAVLSDCAEEAVGHLEQDPAFDLVLSDLGTAGTEGIGLMGRMRRMELDIPVVLLASSPSALWKRISTSIP